MSNRPFRSLKCKSMATNGDYHRIQTSSLQVLAVSPNRAKQPSRARMQYICLIFNANFYCSIQTSHSVVSLRLFAFICDYVQIYIYIYIYTSRMYSCLHHEIYIKIYVFAMLWFWSICSSLSLWSVQLSCGIKVLWANLVHSTRNQGEVTWVS